ncbi:MAG: hypothetical protein IJY39_05645 [Clostridia bacterium]|nr:hypothetical protein [Clostridia bacterium]
MLKKMLKYDMRSVGRVWWIMAISVLGLSLLGMLALKLLFEVSATITSTDLEVFYVLIIIFCVLFFVMCIVGIVGSSIVTAILVYLRFYKHFFTDEGYLTFTLPVSRKTLLLSKSINAMIWTSAHLLLIGIAVCILSMGFPSEYYDGSNYYGLFALIGKLIRSAWSEIGAWMLVYLLEGVVAIGVLLAFSVALVHFCITVASVIAKRAKLLVAIGIYYGANTVVSLATQMLTTVLSMIFGTGALMDLLENSSPTVTHIAVALLILLVTLIVSAVTAVLYFNTLDCIERKLNLA